MMLIIIMMRPTRARVVAYPCHGRVILSRHLDLYVHTSNHERHTKPDQTTKCQPFHLGG